MPSFVFRQDLVDALAQARAQRLAPFGFPDVERGLIQNPRQPALAEMLDGVSIVQEAAVWTFFVNQIERECFVVDLDAADGMRQPANDLVAEHQHRVGTGSPLSWPKTSSVFIIAAKTSHREAWHLDLSRDEGFRPGQVGRPLHPGG